MTYGKIFAIIIALCGMVFSFINLIMLARCTLSQKVPATIIRYRGRGVNFGIFLFTYHVVVAPSVVLQLEREVMPLMNFLPFYSINNYVGRNVMVPFDSKKQKLLPHEPILVVKLVLSLIVATMGILMLIVLDRLQH